MKNILSIALVFIGLLKINAQTYPSLNINLMAHLDPETDQTGGDRKYSGCWGWYQASTNKEYAIIGTSAQTYFIDMTDAVNPIIVDSVKARRTGCTWREIKTYQHYCYMVSDDGPPNSFQIVDMQYLPDSVHVVYDDTTYFERCHTIFVDKDNLYCGSVTNRSGAYSTMRVYSLATPTAPALMRKLEQDVSTAIIDVVHDMYVRNDTVYASCGNKGFFVLKLDPITYTLSLLQSFTGYPYAGYNHSSWQTDDRKTMVFTDEVPSGLPAKVIDVQNLSNILLVDTIRSHLHATAHNPYIIGNKWCWISSYQDGIYLYDISTPANTSIYGYFDTHPQHGVNDNFFGQAYSGNWGAYPYLPSKKIIACDMQNGVFILEADYFYQLTVGTEETPLKKSTWSVFPNPAKNEITVLLANQENKSIHYTITDILGKTMYENVFDVNAALYKGSVNTSSLSEGCYLLTLNGKNFSETKKIIILE